MDHFDGGGSGEHADFSEDRKSADSIFLAGSRRIDGRPVAFRERYISAADHETIHGVVVTCPAQLAAICVPVAERITQSLQLPPPLPPR